jgi:hypothetical protein
MNAPKTSFITFAKLNSIQSIISWRSIPSLDHWIPAFAGMTDKDSSPLVTPAEGGVQQRGLRETPPVDSIMALLGEPECATGNSHQGTNFLYEL